MNKIIKSPNEKVAFLYFDIEGELSFIAGQFVVFDIEIDNKSVKRSYSIATSPNYLKEEKKIGVIVKLVTWWLVSNKLLNMKVGEKLKIIWPAWHMFLEENFKQYNHVLISTGSWLSPIYSILQTLIENNSKKNTINIFWERSNEYLIPQIISCLTMSKENIMSNIVLSREVKDIWYSYTKWYVQVCLDKNMKEIKSRTGWTKRFICWQPAMVEDVYENLINKYDIEKDDISFEKY